MSEGVNSVLILGAGIVGSSTAYYLRKLAGEGLRIVVLDKEGVAAGASGRAGGFLARDWHGHGPTAALAAHSFLLHSTLAQEFGAKNIGYRSCQAVQPTCSGGKTQKQGSKWFDGCPGDAPVIASRDTAAQVIPARLTNALLTASRAELVIGEATSVQTLETGAKVVNIATAGDSFDFTCDALLLACGPWTKCVATQLGIEMAAEVLGLKAYSILLKPKTNSICTPVDDSCLFMDWRGDPVVGEFELYPRIDGVYVCGCGEKPRVVTESPADVTCSEKVKACLAESAASISSALDGADILRETACYLPVSDRGIVAGKLADAVYVATGHSCWGILNGPATGHALAELILKIEGGKAAHLISSFSP